MLILSVSHSGGFGRKSGIFSKIRPIFRNKRFSIYLCFNTILRYSECVSNQKHTRFSYFLSFFGRRGLDSPLGKLKIGHFWPFMWKKSAKNKVCAKMCIKASKVGNFAPKTDLTSILRFEAFWGKRVRFQKFDEFLVLTKISH